MKAVILAGGFGTRIYDGSDLCPKPMLEIDNNPILWHIMKYYSYYGFSDFIICCGYKAHTIKEYFSGYFLRHSDFTCDFSDNSVTVHAPSQEKWKVTLVDTGYSTMTGGRLKRVKDYIGDETFLFTYGDGLCDVDINEVVKFHRRNNKTATITAVLPLSRFGVLEVSEDDRIVSFREKSRDENGWINGGYMVLSPKIFDYIDSDDTVFEEYPLSECARRNELMAFRHRGFWQCMDTMRDKRLLEELIKKGDAPWMKWE